MKRSDMILKISEKLQKQAHIIKDSKMSLKQKCDNLASRVLTEIEKNGMLPPQSSHFEHFNLEDDEGSYWNSQSVINCCHTWEPEE